MYGFKLKFELTYWQSFIVSTDVLLKARYKITAVDFTFSSVKSKTK